MISCLEPSKATKPWSGSSFPVSILGSLPESTFLLPLLRPWYSNLSVCTSGNSHLLTLRPPGKALMSIMSYPATQNPLPCHLVPLAKAATLASCPVSRHSCIEAFSSSTLGKYVVSVYKNKSITEAFIHCMSHTFKLTCCKIWPFGCVYSSMSFNTFVYLCNCCHNQSTESSHHPQNSLLLLHCRVTP